ncbi:uncharacterized protein LOC134831603 isoform X2 [Culicoides brevitarsis]|uniref:uncharacterized protein LOC134831603 isoform X2 n=1 Tax=Culicoides brevitarsis TaxID=469753 RepID=UPI00307B4E2E
MRNRTEAVTNNLPDSEEEEEVGDSEEDWQPDDDEKPKKRKAAGGSAKKAKNGARGGARGSAKKRKKDESEEEEEESEPEEDESEEEDSKKGAGSAKKGSGGGAKNFPDKQGFLSLYIYRGDLVNGIRANDNLCLWRRDGSSLLQKYLRDKNSSECQWSPSMVYSCWEDRRKDEYLEVKVLCKGDLKNSNVTIVELDQLEEQCVRERDSNAKFVSQKPQGQGNSSANDSQAGNTSQEGLEEEEGDEGEEE